MNKETEKEQQLQASNEWISVEDRLPELENVDTSFRKSEYVNVWGKGVKFPEIAKLEGEKTLYWYFPANDETSELETIEKWSPIPKS